jgi:hypothetical protein
MGRVLLRWHWIRAFLLVGLAGCGASAAGQPDSGQTGICHGGCLCFQTEAQCTTNGCYVEYDRSVDGAQQFSGCLNAAPSEAGAQ